MHGMHQIDDEKFYESTLRVATTLYWHVSCADKIDSTPEAINSSSTDTTIQFKPINSLEFVRQVLLTATPAQTQTGTVS